VNVRLADWIQLALATPVVLWPDGRSSPRAWDSLVNRSPNMFTLIGAGVGAAYAYSLVATVAPGVFPEGFRMQRSRRARTSTPQSSSRRSSCSGKCWRFARAAARRRR